MTGSSINRQSALKRNGAQTAGARNTGNNDRLLYYCLLFYTFLFYSQIAGRFPILSPIRLEFVVGAFMVFVCLWKILRRQVDIRENRLNIAALLFIGFALFTIPFSLVRSRALLTFIDMFKFFAIYVMLIVSINTERKLKGYMIMYLLMVTWLFIEPFVYSIQGKGFIYNNHMMRLAGVPGYFGHPNQLGGIVSANLPFFYYMMIYARSRKMKVLNLVLMGISLWVVMLTQSRTAFVGVVTFFAVVWWMSRRKMVLAVLLSFLCAFLWFSAPEVTKDRFLTMSEAGGVISGDIGHEEAGSMFSRWVLFKRGLVAFAENPIMGLGLNNFISFNGMRYGYWFPPHNTFIQLLAEMGLVGFVIFMWVIILTFRNLIRARRLLSARKEEGLFIYIMSTMVIVYLSLRIMVGMFGQDLYANYWWMAAGLSVVILRLANNAQEQPLERPVAVVGQRSQLPPRLRAL